MKIPLSTWLRKHQALLEKHQKIDAVLQAEQARPAPDPWRIQRLKKLKLAIKDRVAALAGRRVVTH